MVPGRVVERDRAPFVVGQRPFEVGIAGRQKRLVVDFADAFAAGTLGVVDVDDDRLRFAERQRLGDGGREFGVG